MAKTNYSFNVQVVSLNDVFKYGVNFRRQYYMEWEYDNLSDMLFMFDPYRELVIFPDTVTTKDQKTTIKILHRIINRPNWDSRGQEKDCDRLEDINGHKEVYPAAFYMFKHYYDKRHELIKWPIGHSDKLTDTHLFYLSDNKFLGNRVYKVQNFEDFLAGNDVYHTYK